MPPRRQRADRPPATHRQTRKSARNTRKSKDAVPNVYQDMLAEAQASESTDFAPSPRPTKRQKIVEEPIVEPSAEAPQARSATPETTATITTPEQPRVPQVVFDDFEDSDGDDDDEFEDVILEPTNDEPHLEDEQPAQKLLQLDLSKPVETTPKRAIQRRKPITKADRAKCLDVHKWHLMSLLLHQFSRNIWCENEEIHAILKPLVKRKTIALLHVDESQPNFEQNHSFIQGIEELCSIWRREWQVNVRGMRRAYWDDSVDAQEAFDDAEDPIDFDDFKTAAQTRRGSRDLGAQLFCALLRSVAVDTRLVFSLQVLPYSGDAKPQSQSTPRKSDYIYAGPQSYGNDKPASRSGNKKKILDSPYPVFWVEVLNPATTTWIPIDPLVRNTINKPKTQFEPPASDILNSMTYVVAFEDDNSARDVTRRYAHWFNAKTRKSRIENTKGGQAWYESVMRVFERKINLPRDMVEDDQLIQRAAAEGLPKNVQDFRNHPVYVLERHLRRNEVIEPKREVGKVSTGVSKLGKLESVYRRQDVYLCRSADAWYRRGMDVKIGEQPLKRVAPTVKQRDRAPSEEDEDEEANEGVALYAEYQTQVYEPPPVVNGKIPKNAYGNLDVYVPSMIPPGAVHIMHTMANQAAKLLAVDYADAVTGFDFKGRQGTAVINGVVVSARFTAAVTATIESLESQGTQEVQAERSRIVLTIWKRLLTALRIREKLEQEYGGKMREEEDAEGDEIDSDDDDPTYTETKVEDDGGGFMLEADETAEKVEEQNISLQGLKSKFPTTLPDEVVQQPIRIVKSPHKLPSREAVNIAQVQDDEVIMQDAVRHYKDSSNNKNSGVLAQADELGLGGGFMAEDAEEDAGGGFMVENEAEGGGFIADDDSQGQLNNKAMPNDDLFDDEDNTTSQIPPPTFPIQEDNSNHSIDGGGFVPDNDDDDDNSINHTTIPVPQTTQSPTNSQPRHTQLPTITSRTNPNPNSRQEASPKSETNSLLSHDPDEDDDEPEWLAEAMDE